MKALIRINRAGQCLLLPDDPASREIAIPGNARLTVEPEDHVLVGRDLPAK